MDSLNYTFIVSYSEYVSVHRT